MKELTRQKLTIFRNAMLLLWQEFKTLNMKKLRALVNMAISYLRMRFNRTGDRNVSGR